MDNRDTELSRMDTEYRDSYQEEVNNDETQNDQNEAKMQLKYGVNDVPSWFSCILLGLQVINMYQSKLFTMKIIINCDINLIYLLNFSMF